MAIPYAASIGIGELSERSGISVRALRYYEQHGLLSAIRDSGGHRRFDPAAVETVRRIRLFLDAGLPLAVVSHVMECFVQAGTRLDGCVAAYLRDRMDSIRVRLEELDEQRATIERLQKLVVT